MTKHSVSAGRMSSFLSARWCMPTPAGMGVEGIVSKRLIALPVRPIAGLAEVQELDAPAVKREAEEGW